MSTPFCSSIVARPCLNECQPIFLDSNPLQSRPDMTLENHVRLYGLGSIIRDGREEVIVIEAYRMANFHCFNSAMTNGWSGTGCVTLPSWCRLRRCTRRSA